MGLLEHNQRVYNETRLAYERSKDVIIVHGTGLGKSFLFLELGKTLFKDKKILYVIPKHKIKEGLQSYDEFDELEEMVVFSTYNYFTSEEKTLELLNSYDVFIFDECHHLGSSFYGQNARMLFDVVRESDDKYILGLTATNQREDDIDVCEYFSEVVLGESIFDAIREGLIPPFQYLICEDDANEKLGNDEDPKKFRKVLDYGKSLPLLSSTIEKNPRDRWICFFANIRSMENHVSLIHRIFPDHQLVMISSRHHNDLESILEMDQVVIMSVDMLLEGVHLPQIGGIILFRNVQSIPVFQQILGRLVRVGNQIPPLILDCTKVALKIFAKLLKEDEHGFGIGGGEDNTEIKPILFCDLINTEQFDLMKVLVLMTTGAWTEEEDAILQEKYQELSCKELEKLLPGRSQQAIVMRAGRLGLTMKLGTWTEDETNLLITNAPTHTIKGLAELLPDKTIQQIRSKISQLQLDHLKEVGHNQWSINEVATLKAIYATSTKDEILDALPGRSWESIKMQLRKYRLRKVNKWDDKKDEFLRTHYGAYNNTLLAMKLHVSTKMLECRATELKVSGDPELRRQNQYNFIATRIKDHSAQEIADESGRSLNYIYKKITEMRKAGYLT